MKLIIDGSKLKEAVMGIKNGLGNAKSNVLYETIGMWTEGSTLVLETQDDITKMNAIVECEIAEQGVFRCSGSVFINLVSQLGGDSVELSTNGETLSIKQNGAKVKVKRVQGFIEKDQDADNLFNAEIEVKGSELADAITHALVCVAKNDTRMLLRCINFQKDYNRMRVSSLDGFRVSRYFVEYTQKGGDNFNSSMPTKAVPSILSLCDANETITIKFGYSRIAFIGQNGAVYSGLYQGDFYDCNKAFPASHNYDIIADMKELKRAVSLTTITTDDKFNTLLLSFDMATKELSVSSQKENAESAVVVPFKCELGENNIELALNASFLNEALKAMKDETVVLELVDSLKPVVIRPDDSDDSFLLLPIRRV